VTEIDSNEKIKFDNTGVADVKKDLGEKLIVYSKWFTEERIENKIIPKSKKVDIIDEQLKDQLIETLNEENSKLKMQIESRISKFKSLEEENSSIRGDMQKIIDEKKILVEEKERIFESHKDEIEDLKYRHKLSELSVSKLQEMCVGMGIEEKDYITEKQKKPLIEMIIKASK